MRVLQSFIQRSLIVGGCFIAGMVVFAFGFGLLPVPAAAQTGGVCPPVVTQALQSVGVACDGLGRNSACYGYNAVSATFNTPQRTGFFSRVGDTSGLLELETLRTAPLDLARNEWGVALMNVQASLPNSLPGQSVTFLLLGDAQIENAVDPATAFRGGIPVNVRTTSVTTLFQQPDATSDVVATLEANAALPADARSADDGWFRVSQGGQYGWVSRTALTVPPPAARLPVFTPDVSAAPMQAFFLRTGVGAPVCSDAPDALVIQGPQNLTVDLNVNGADIRVGSTVVIRTLPEGETGSDASTATDDVAAFMQISVLDGEVVVNPDSDTPTVIEEDETSTTCLSAPQSLGADGVANDQTVTGSCEWEEPAPIDPALRESLRLLDNYVLDYPIPVFEDGSPTPVIPTAQPPDATPPPVENTLIPVATQQPTNPPVSTVPPATLPPVTQVPPTMTPTSGPPGTVDLRYMSWFESGANDESTTPSSEVRMRIIIINDGPATATNLVMTNMLPVGATYGIPSSNTDFFVRGSSYPGAFDADTQVWVPGPLGAGQTITLTVQLDVNSDAAGKIFTFNPTLTHDQVDNNLANNAVPNRILVRSVSDLAARVENFVTPVAGQISTITFAVENLGTRSVVNPSLVVQLSSNLSLLSTSVTTGSYDPPTRTWTLPQLSPGDSRQIVLTYVNDGTGPASIIGQVFSTLVFDILASNNTANVGFTPIPAIANLEVLSVDIGPAQPFFSDGEAITLGIRVFNPGNVMMENVQMSSLLDDDIDFVSSSGPGVYDAGLDNWSFGPLAAGSTATLTLNGIIDGTPGTTLSNLVILFGSTPGDGNAADNSATYSVALRTGQDLSVSVGAPVSGEAGDTIAYTITATNNAGVTANDIQVSITQPPSLMFVSSSAPVPGNIWTVGSLTSGNSINLTLAYSIPGGAVGTAQPVSASISSAANDDPVAANNSDTDSFTPTVPLVDVGFDGLNVVNSPFEEGETIFITHTVNNTDLVNPANNIVITDLLPPGVTYANYTGPGTYNVGTDTLTIGSLTANNISSLSFGVTVNAGTAQTLLNSTATLTAANDSSPGDNSQVVGIFISSSIDLGITGLASTVTPTVGTPFTITYTLINSNLSQAAVSVDVPFTVPAGYTLNSATPNAGTVSGFIWSIPLLNANSSVQLQLDLTATPPTLGIPAAFDAGAAVASNNVDDVLSNNITSVVITPG